MQTRTRLSLSRTVAKPVETKPTERRAGPSIHQDGLVSEAMLFDRGWTAELISDFLGAPDNYVKVQSTRVGLYNLTRTEVAERLPGFKIAKSRQTSESRKETVAAPAPSLSMSQLRRLAIAQANSTRKPGEPEYGFASGTEVIDRLMVDYLLSHRATQGPEPNGLDAIAREYPSLAAECARRVHFV